MAQGGSAKRSLAMGLNVRGHDPVAPALSLFSALTENAMCGEGN